MFRRQTTGSVVCPSCGKLVGVRDEKCWSCGRLHPGLWGWAPALRALGRDLGVTPLIVGACAVLYLAMLVVDPQNVELKLGFQFLGPSPKSVFLFGASGALPVFQAGRWWTLLSAGWLHGGLLHILFNMMWIRQLMPATVQIYGPGRAVIIYTLSSTTGFAFSSGAVFFPRLLLGIMGVGPITLGASAALFGLMGALIHYSRRTGHSALGQQVWGWAILLFVFGLVMRGVDNWAHLGGFLGGYAVASWLDPLRPERGDHLLAGLACLAAAALAVAASIVHGLRIL